MECCVMAKRLFGEEGEWSAAELRADALYFLGAIGVCERHRLEFVETVPLGERLFFEFFDDGRCPGCESHRKDWWKGGHDA